MPMVIKDADTGNTAIGACMTPSVVKAVNILNGLEFGTGLTISALCDRVGVHRRTLNEYSRSAPLVNMRVPMSCGKGFMYVSEATKAAWDADQEGGEG